MNASGSSDTLTNGFRVIAKPAFLAGESDMSANPPRYVFGYRMLIRNEGDSAAQLLSRHWIIIDGHGIRREVHGEGVIGNTPMLQPGQEFEYSSFCPLETEWGTMEGSYQMMRDDGWMFDITIGRFYLNTNAPRAALKKSG
jgi:ApaG protein